MKELPNAKGRIQQKMGAVELKLQRRQLMLSGHYSVGVKNNGDYATQQDSESSEE